MNPYILAPLLFIGILFDWYTTKVGLSLGLKESYPLFKNRSHKQILAIKLLGFVILCWGMFSLAAESITVGPTIPMGWGLFVSALTALQFFAAWRNWKKIQVIKKERHT